MKEVLAALHNAELRHSFYEKNTLAGKRDNNWAEWYAAFLIANYPVLFEQYRIFELTALLIEATAKAGTYDWFDFTANYLAEEEIEAIELITGQKYI